jgi:hypothetical protein
MLVAAPPQRRQVVHTALSMHSVTFPSVPAVLASPRLLDWFASSDWYSPYPTNSDRDCASFHQKLRRCISSSSLIDPPSVFTPTLYWLTPVLIAPRVMEFGVKRR